MDQSPDGILGASRTGELRPTWNIINALAHPPGALALILAVTLLQGLLFVVLYPPWQHYDEPTHFEYAWLIANRDRLPKPGDVDPALRRAILVSMIKHKFYAGSPVPDLQHIADPVNLGFSELTHPPGYYLLVSLPLRLVRHWDVAAQLYMGRLVSLGLFLLTAAVVYGCMLDLVPKDHPLALAVPLVLVLLPTVADIMTAVNNDVGAVFTFSLFLWGAVRAIRYGLNMRRLLWLLVTAGGAMAAKATAGIALALLPVVLIIALWVRRGWRWRWLCIVAATGVLGLAITLLTWGDAAYWYRWQVGRPQYQATRSEAAGGSVIALEGVAGEPYRYLLNPILPNDVQRLAGQTVTVGGWISASRPTTVTMPGLVMSPQGSTTLTTPRTTIRVTTTPTFVATTLPVPGHTGVLYYGFFGDLPAGTVAPTMLFLHNPVLALGTFPATAPPLFTDMAATRGTWDGHPFTNLVRNAGAQLTWPRFRPSVQNHELRSLSIDHYLAALLDIRQNGPLLLWTADPFLLTSFFGRFAWGHIIVSGLTEWWVYPLNILVAAVLVGLGRWTRRARSLPRGLLATLGLLVIAALVVWLSAVLWPLPYRWAKRTLPAARYGFPALLPTLLVLTGGWWALWPQRYRNSLLGLWVAGFFVLDGVGIFTIWSFYHRVGAGLF